VIGALMKVEASFPMPIGDAEVDENESVSDCATCDRVTLIAHQAGLERAAPRIPELVRAPMLSVPGYVHAAQPKLTRCYGVLKALIEKERALGFNDPNGTGLDWMKSVNAILFHTSVFHQAFAARGQRVPEAFVELKDIKLCEKQKAPQMEAAGIEDFADKLAGLLLYSRMQAEPWSSSEFKVALVQFHTCLVGVAARMNADSSRHRNRTQGLMSAFAVRSPQPGTSFRSVEHTEHVRPVYADVDGALRALPVGAALNTEYYEPLDHIARYDWFRDLHLSKPCHLINFDVGGAIGTLHWLIILEDGLEPGAVANELNAERERLSALVPVVHARVIKRNVMKRFRDLSSMPKGAATFWYKMITGDESHATNRAEAQREAYAAASLFAESEAPADIILDLRAHANSKRSGTSHFEAFWDVVHEVRESFSPRAFCPRAFCPRRGGRRRARERRACVSGRVVQLLLDRSLRALSPRAARLAWGEKPLRWRARSLARPRSLSLSRAVAALVMGVV